MLKKYEELNLQAKDYFIIEIEKVFYKKYKDKELLVRCYKEMDILFEKGLLFIIEHLYKYKNQSKAVCYYFSGSTNNLFLLYLLELNKVNPIEYNLPYELFREKVIKVQIAGAAYGLLYYLQRCDDFKIVSGSFEKEEIEEINKIEEDHYLLIPESSPINDMLFKLNKIGMFETVDDYRKYKDNYITIRLSDRCPITKYKSVGIENVISNEFEKQLANILKPKTINDYIKIKSLAHGANVWKYNQDKLVEFNMLDLNSIISNREDVYEYLLEHSIPSEKALEILNFVNIMHISYYSNIWDNYVEIMKSYKCDDIFIEIIENVDYLSSRGQAVSECLFTLDIENYIQEK